MQRKAGQSLAEYTLLGGMLALTLIGGLTTLTNTLDATFLEMSNRFSGGAGAAANANGVNANNNEVNGFAEVNITLKDGSILNLADFPVNGASVIETSGANGYTKQLSNALLSLSKQLEEAGEITPEQSALFAQLAQRGHNMAGAQSAVEKVIKNNGSLAWTEIAQLKVPYFSPDDTIQRWINAFDIPNKSMESIQAAIDAGQLETIVPHAYNHESASFIHMYKDLKQSGAMNNPQINEVVSHLAGEIFITAKSMVGTVKHLRDQTDPVGDLGSFTGMHAEAYSTATHGNSSGICVAGGSKSTGVSCS